MPMRKSTLDAVQAALQRPNMNRDHRGWHYTDLCGATGFVDTTIHKALSHFVAHNKAIRVKYRVPGGKGDTGKRGRYYWNWGGCPAHRAQADEWAAWVEAHAPTDAQPCSAEEATPLPFAWLCEELGLEV